MSRGTTKRLRSQRSRFGSSVSSGERSSVFSAKLADRSDNDPTHSRLIEPVCQNWLSLSCPQRSAPRLQPARLALLLAVGSLYGVQECSRNHRFNSSRECTPCTKRLFAGVISAETSLGTGSWALLRRNSQARQAAEKSQTAEKQPPGLKPGIYRSVLAGLKTRYPGLKSGAGTD
jgi:hypothetical protein